MGYEGDPDASLAAAAHESLGGAEHLLLTRCRLLRGELVGLLEHQVQSLAVAAVKAVTEVGDEPALRRLGLEPGEIRLN